jgi:magnesium-protoporphyrin IX monomethyl ester (oxidative) cyclase
MTVDIDHPGFRASMERLRRISDGMSAAKERGGVIGRLKWLTYTGAAALSFARLYLIPAKSNELPAQSRLVPTW